MAYLNTNRFKWLAAVAAIALCIVTSSPVQASPPPERRLLPLIPSGGTKVLDWTRISFQTFGGMHQAGQFKAPPQLTSYLGFDPSVAWSKGTPVASVIRLGFVDQAFGLQLLSLDPIAAYTGIDVKSMPLSAYGLLKWQTLGSLVQAVPGLANLYPSQVPPIAALIGNGYGYATMTIGQILASQPGLATLPLTPILNSYPIGSIPGLSAARIDGFHLWKAAFISDIPGLTQLVFARFPIQPKSTFQSQRPTPHSTLIASIGKIGTLLAQANAGPFSSAAGAALFDLPFNFDGFILTNVITGSDRVGFNFPCAQPACGHVELGLPFQGARFISGTQQWVLGGHNLLGELFGSIEPTGRPLVGNPNPEKEPFKLLLNWADDTTGTALFGLAMHWCIHHSWPDPLPNPDCTPYIFEFPGVWLWIEGEVMYIGGPGKPSPN
ncbi:MAG: hypothetical protein WCD18_08635 [Thermosynechococcaceae cyanobacterium]